MKSVFVFLIITSIILLSVGLPISAQPLPPKTLKELLHEYNLVVRGQIISVSKIPEKNLTSYDIKILEYITQPQTAQVITAVINSTGNNTVNSVIPVFAAGDNVQLYLESTSHGYIISPYSFEMDKKCGFVGPTYLTVDLLSSGVATSSKFFDSKGNVIYPVPNQQLFFFTELDNDTPLNKTDAELIIKHEGNIHPILDERKQFSLQPCSTGNATWTFTLPQAGSYTIEYKQMSRIYENKIFFGNSTFTYSFIIPTNTIVKPDLIHSLTPFKQFQSGISANNVVCKEGLHLVIKSEDGSPACVKPDTGQILVERGWAKPI